MTDAMIWVIIIGIITLVTAMVYDTCFRCKHEWEQHNFQKGGVTKYYLTCKKCGKVKVLK